MSAKAATADGHYEDVAVKFIKEMEDYKTKMSGLIGKIRVGLKETRQEAVAALRSDGSLEAESDAVPSGRLPSAPIVGERTAEKGEASSTRTRLIGKPRGCRERASTRRRTARRRCHSSVAVAGETPGVGAGEAGGGAGRHESCAGTV